MSPPFPEQLVPSRSPPLPPVIVHMAMHLACEGAHISFHHCFQSMINTVIPPPPGADSNHPEQFVTVCFRVCTHLYVYMCSVGQKQLLAQRPLAGRRGKVQRRKASLVFLKKKIIS